MTRNLVRSLEENKLIEEGIKLLVVEFMESGKNPKPVILHSVRMAMYLEKLGYSQNIIIGAILHDLLEDTEIDPKEIKDQFGEEILKLVEANSFDKSITDKIKQYKKLFVQCKKSGKDALIIKAADILDNSNYYDQNKHLWEKLRYFIDFSSNDLKKEQVWQDLNKKYKKCCGR